MHIDKYNIRNLLNDEAVCDDQESEDEESEASI